MFGHYALAIGRGAHRHDLEANASAAGLAVRAATADLLLVASESTQVLHDGPALLVGQLFDGTGARLQHIPDAFKDASGRTPLPQSSAAWGNFALFAANGPAAAVYREPSGSVPVYRCGSPGADLFVSDAHMAKQLGLLGQRRIDRAFLIHWLQYPFLRTARTGLEGVRELLPGMRILRERDPGEWRPQCAWHPAAFVGRDARIADPGEARARLRDLALRIVPQQVEPLGGTPMLRLSGGLDSSIIAACLGKAGLRLPCINFATSARDGNERTFASQVADAFDLDLVDVTEPAGAALPMPRRPGFRPSINPLLEPFERAIAEAAEAQGVTLLVDGGGGDNLFCSLGSTSPVFDALRLAGPRQMARTIGDIATRADTTVWHVVRAACRRAFRRNSLWDEDRTFLRPQVLARTPDLHPWLQNLRAPPGAREHVHSLAHIQHFLDRTALSADLLHPLLAQPLLELCLGIPSYRWVRGGRDRAIAREAFEGLLPQTVLDRRLKGSLQSMLHRAFEGLREPMIFLLGDGELVRAGILDPAQLRAALTSDAWQTDAVQLRVSELAALELWIRAWRSATPPPTSS